MSALTDFAHKFGSEPRELKIGQSFFNRQHPNNNIESDAAFHTVRYDFVPASIDPNKTSAVDICDNGKVVITMPNIEGSGTTESVYQGQKKPHQQKECVLIIDNETGEMILERLSQSMIVKKARLRQEDLTGKSLALNSNQMKSMNSMSNGGQVAKVSANILSNKTQIAKVTTHKNTTKKKPNSSPPPLLDSIVKTNGTMAKSPSPPSMPIFNNGALLPTNNISNHPNHTSFIKKTTNNNANSSLTNTLATTKLLSEESSSDSDDDDLSSADSSNESSEHEASAKDSIDPKKKNLLPMKPANRGFREILSMPTLIAPDTVVSTAVENKKASLSLSDDSDMSSDDDDDFVNVPEKSMPKFTNGHGGNGGANDGTSSVTPLTSALATTSLPSMPKFSQLSQDLQLSESSGSDSDDA